MIGFMLLWIWHLDINLKETYLFGILLSLKVLIIKYTFAQINIHTHVSRSALSISENPPGHRFHKLLNWERHLI